MRVRKSRGLVFGAVTGLAAVLAMTVGVYRVLADAGLNPFVDVNIVSPVSSNETILMTAYSAGAAVPPSIPIGVTTLVEDVTARGDAVNITDVRTVLGGDLDAGTITNELQNVDATLVNSFLGEEEYLAVVDASRLDFVEPTRGGIPALFASDVIRTVAIASGYYTRTVSNIVEYDEIGIDVEIRDLSEVDADGNLIPDATALLQPFLLLFDQRGNITVVLSLNDEDLRGTSLATYETAVQTVLGPMNVSVAASSLSEIIAQSGGAIPVSINTGRLIVTITQDPAEIMDGPGTVDPVAEFDLEDGGDPLPPPRNLFVRANVALTSVASRGAAPDWLFLDTLPGNAFFQLNFSGPGIAGLLEDGVVVAGYTYNVILDQDGEEILSLAPNPLEGWVDVSDDVTLADFDNADDAFDSRFVVADDGDDTISISGNNVSAIYGSNAVPRVGSSGGGGGSGCFIATAAYGTPLAGEINALRDVRDEYMLSNAIGSVFADAYYRLSPPIAADLSQHGVARTVVRTALVPVVALSRWVLVSPASLVLALVAMAALVALGRQARRA